MATGLVPLIDAHHTTGDARVDHAGLAQQLEALHLHSFGWAMACCERRRDEAEDVLHDVYVKVLGGEARFDGRSTFKTWLFGVIRRTASARARKGRLHALLGLRIERSAPASSPEEDAIATDRQARTRNALRHLSTRQREVLQLVFYHDLTLEEAAAIMNVSIGSVRVHYHRGKTRMAALLREDRP
jgi:RNA polymerase sigma factor (sigma-70 family)